MKIENKIIEFRCLGCNSLFCKCTPNSIVEVKCKKCKLFYVFNNGEVFSNKNNNYFKGDD